MDAPIKKPVIGKFSRALDISQTDMKKMYLSDKTITSFDILELAGELYTETWTSSTTITSTGTKTFIYTPPANKRIRLNGIYVFGATGVWTTNSIKVSLMSKSTTSALGGVVHESGVDVLSGGDLVFMNPIVLNPGDFVKVTAYVDSYTSGSGTISINVLGTIWEA